MNDTFLISVDSARLLQMLFMAFMGFALSMVLTPLYTTFAYRGKWWKKPRTEATTGEKAKIFAKLHAGKHRRNIPTMAGLIFVVSVAAVTVALNFSREQTWLPIAAFLGAGFVGLIDDIVNLKGSGNGTAGLSTRLKLGLITFVALIGGLFFYYKLDYSTIQLPGVGDIGIGWLIIPLFVLVVVSTANAVNISDGLDGLAGGLASSAFGVYAIIAFMQGRFGIAGFCLTIVGALLSYTWFNIYPARFFMGDVGSFALGTALGVVAMITDTVLLLPIIGAVFVVEAGSSLVQITSKKLRGGKKVFKVAPIHHHFEASGWPETKVTMRFWILGQVCAFVGLMIFIIGNYHV
ncbi:MAG TPA: phospho-N-acetylmuramoyl-pentapeptide-transferase [Candidatus Saccharimonadales bacterium]|nr:phospho-N-acetylmuramoyl-pentapeptide-transferase [Candidatus Saccharimonadales bacterium]